MKDYIWNTAFLIVLVANTALLWNAGWDYWIIAPIIAQSLMLIGIVEILHHSVHNNFLPGRALNTLTGLLSGFILGTNFYSYRELHRRHHMHTNTRLDPEQDFYRDHTGKLATLLLIPIILMRNINITNGSAYLVGEDKKSLYLANNIALLIVVGLFIVALVMYPEPLLRIYVLPLAVFYYIEFFMAHSQHYDTKYFDHDRPTLVEQSEVSTDIVLPYPVGFLVMFANYHSAHHRAQSAKWYEMPNIAKQFPEARVWTVGQFLTLWWRDGRRAWDQQWRRDTASQ